MTAGEGVAPRGSAGVHGGTERRQMRGAASNTAGLARSVYSLLSEPLLLHGHGAASTSGVLATALCVVARESMDGLQRLNAHRMCVVSRCSVALQRNTANGALRASCQPQAGLDTVCVYTYFYAERFVWAYVCRAPSPSRPVSLSGVSSMPRLAQPPPLPPSERSQRRRRKQLRTTLKDV